MKRTLEKAKYLVKNAAAACELQQNSESLSRIVKVIISKALMNYFLVIHYTSDGTEMLYIILYINCICLIYMFVMINIAAKWPWVCERNKAQVKDSYIKIRPKDSNRWIVLCCIVLGLPPYGTCRLRNSKKVRF